MIPQHYPLYISDLGHAQTWLVLGWVPNREAGLPHRPIVLLCGSETQEPRVLEQTVPYRIVGTGNLPV